MNPLVMTESRILLIVATLIWSAHNASATTRTATAVDDGVRTVSTIDSRISLREWEHQQRISWAPNFVQYTDHPYASRRGLSIADSSGEASFQPIRVVFETSRLDAVPESELVSWIRSNALVQVSKYWGEALSVHPIQGNLILAAHQLSQGRFCGLPEWGEVPSHHFTTGVPNADLLIYVSAVDDARFCSRTTLATAMLCNVDQFDRPIGGAINLCPSLMDMDERTAFQVILHEITHVLGFSSWAFSFFWDPLSGLPRTTRPLVLEPVTCVDGSTRTIAMPSSTTLQIIPNELEQRHAFVVTPKVQTFVRNQFDCHRLPGAPLESSSTVQSCFGDHWDERLFATSNLSPIRQGSAPTQMTPVTLALLEDSGWYKVNYTKAEISTWGYGMGCDFVFGPCLESNSPSPTVPEYGRGFFCGQDGAMGCTPDLGAKQACAIYNHNNPLPIQYFPDRPTMGGLAQMDYCPVYAAKMTFNGQVISLDCKEANNQPDGDPFGFFGWSSQCIESNAGQPLCLETRCETQEMTLSVFVRGERLVCHSDFQKLVTSWGVELTCPRLRQACPNMFCPSLCMGKGRCNFQKGRCECFDPFDRTLDCSDIFRSSAGTLPSNAPTRSPILPNPPPLALTSTAPTRMPITAKPSNSPTMYIAPTPRPTSHPTPMPTTARPTTTVPSTRPSYVASTEPTYSMSSLAPTYRVSSYAPTDDPSSMPSLVPLTTVTSQSPTMYEDSPEHSFNGFNKVTEHFKESLVPTIVPSPSTLQTANESSEPPGFNTLENSMTSLQTSQCPSLRTSLLTLSLICLMSQLRF